MPKYLKILLLLLTSAAVWSCGSPGNDYSEYRNLPDELWRYGDTLRFSPTHPDTIAAGRWAVGLRHSNDFEFSTLWIEVVSENPDGCRRTDTLAVALADNFGRWRGQGIGATFQITDTIPRTILHRSGTPVKVRHIMRTDTLSGITQLGLFFLPAPLTSLP